MSSIITAYWWPIVIACFVLVLCFFMEGSRGRQ
jgi:hypothetical protein